MQRRDLLKGGMVAGAGALEACAPARPAAPAPFEPGIMPADMDAFLNDLDARMDGMASGGFVQGFVSATAKKPLTEEQRARIEPNDQLFRGMVRTLYLTQTFRDLPEEAQLHPGMQEKMFRHMGEVNQTVSAVTEHLAKLDGSQRAELRERLRREPQLAMTIAEAIDQQAAHASIPAKRRIQLRSMMAQASFRLKHSSPDTVIDEYVDKARRMTAQSGLQSDLALRVASRVGQDSFWQEQAKYSSSRGSRAYAMNTGAAPTSAEVPPPTPHASSSRAGFPTMNTGAWLMGIGVVVFGVSGLIVAAGAFPFVFGMTVGALLFAAGFICLIVGAIIHAAAGSG
jgi:hypothetical protein